MKELKEHPFFVKQASFALLSFHSIDNLRRQWKSPCGENAVGNINICRSRTQISLRLVLLISKPVK